MCLLMCVTLLITVWLQSRKRESEDKKDVVRSKSRCTSTGKLNRRHVKMGLGTCICDANGVHDEPSSKYLCSQHNTLFSISVKACAPDRTVTCRRKSSTIFTKQFELCSHHLQEESISTVTWWVYKG